MELNLYVCDIHLLSFYVLVWNIIDQHKFQELILFIQYTALEKSIIKIEDFSIAIATREFGPIKLV